MKHHHTLPHGLCHQLLWCYHASLTTLQQVDLKIIAYSSVGHDGYCWR